MDRLEAMAILVAVVETGSFTAAARQLHVPLPTVSRKLGELESHLGVRLLSRTTRRLALTDAGGAYLLDCKRILEDIGNAERNAAGESAAPKGELVITAPIVFGRLHVIPVINEFLSVSPEINIRLLLSDRNVQFLEDQIDIAVRIGALPDSSMVAVRLGSVRQVVCASPRYFAAHGIPKTPGDLAKLACVTFDVLGPAGSWAFAAKPGGRGQTVPIRARLSVNTAEAARDAAIAGLGVARLLSYQVAQAVAQGELQVALKAFEPPPIQVSLVNGVQGRAPPKLRSFLDFATPRLRARLADPTQNLPAAA